MTPVIQRSELPVGILDEAHYLHRFLRAASRRDSVRLGIRRAESVDAERFIEDVGFANTLTDARRAGPSLYIAVCDGDVSLPRSHSEAGRRRQKDEATRLTWYLKDEVMRRGRVYYAKLAGSRSMFVAPRLISHFAAIWMPRRKDKS